MSQCLDDVADAPREGKWKIKEVSCGRQAFLKKSIGMNKAKINHSNNLVFMAFGKDFSKLEKAKTMGRYMTLSYEWRSQPVVSSKEVKGDKHGTSKYY